MKMKKLSIGLSVALCSAFAFMLTSCEGSKKVTYTDENGVEHTVNVKKTSNEEEIAESLTAIVYSKSDNKFKPNGIAIEESAEIKMTGTQVSNNKNFTYGGSEKAKAMFTFGDYEKTENVDKYAAYAEVSANVKLPVAAFETVKTPEIATLTALSETDVDYTKTTDVAVAAKLYAEKDAAYINVTKANLPYEELGINDYKQLVDNNFVNKVVKIDETSAAFIPGVSDVAKVLFNMDEYAKMYYSTYEEDSTFVDSIFDSLKKSAKDSEEFKANLVETLKDTNLVISSVDGSKITLKYGLAKKNLDDLDEEEKKEAYKGDSYVSVTFDIVKKVPTGAKADLGDFITFSATSSLEDTEDAPVKNVKATAKCSLSISYSPKVPTLSDSKKKDALNISGILSALK